MSDDRFIHGYDAGNIIDGVVHQDPVTGEITLVDEDGDKFSPHSALSTLVGKKVRLTIISFEALDNMEKIYREAINASGGEN